MSFRVGPHGVGDFARRQLEAARRDPRLDRGDGRAMIADFWDAMEEAERVRTLSLMGLHELTNALELEEARLGVGRDADDLDTAAAATLQAAYERAEWAKAELAKGSPHGNAQALISMNSALDAMVEDLVKHWRAFHVERIADEMLEGTGGGRRCGPECRSSGPCGGEERRPRRSRIGRAEAPEAEGFGHGSLREAPATGGLGRPRRPADP
jgi:hypothetical protein